MHLHIPALDTPSKRSGKSIIAHHITSYQYRKTCWISTLDRQSCFGYRCIDLSCFKTKFVLSFCKVGFAQ
ncbi:hypothetical protein SUGI_0778370 [Cryptomeria japonica]|nr:hypothetical protein SUGI_0778370 [Cryptomeria japonica]